MNENQERIPFPPTPAGVQESLWAAVVQLVIITSKQKGRVTVGDVVRGVNPTRPVSSKTARRYMKLLAHCDGWERTSIPPRKRGRPRHTLQRV